MATKKDTKKKKDLTITNPYAFFTKGRSKKAIQMDYSMKAKPPSSKEKRVNRTDYPGENLYYLEFFKKHNIPIPKKATKKKTTKKTTAKKTTAKKTTSKKKISEPQITEKTTQKNIKEPKKTTTKKEILDKLSSIRAYQSPLQPIHYSKDNTVIKVTDNPDCFAHPLMILLDRNKNEIDKWLEKYSNRREIQYKSVIKALKDNSKSEQLLPIKFIELVELDEEEKYTFAYLKTKYIAIVEIDNKKYVANPYLLKWLIKENYDIYAKKEILQDNFDFDRDYNYAHFTNFIVILKKNEEVKGLVSGLIYKDENLTNIYREKNQTNDIPVSEIEKIKKFEKRQKKIALLAIIIKETLPDKIKAIDGEYKKIETESKFMYKIKPSIPGSTPDTLAQILTEEEEKNLLKKITPKIKEKYKEKEKEWKKLIKIIEKTQPDKLESYGKTFNKKIINGNLYYQYEGSISFANPQPPSLPLPPSAIIFLLNKTQIDKLLKKE